MNEFVEFLKLHHILILLNIILFVLISFISWDLLWWWNVGDWDPAGRILIVIAIGLINAFAIGAFYDWEKKR